MAGAALIELYQVLKSKPESERITPEEVNVLLGCHVKSLRTAAASSLVGGTLVYAATRRLRTLFRVNLAVGAAAFMGLLANSRSIASCADHILGQDGTRMQRELANIIVRNNHGEAWRWKLMSKHFYSELVYGDASDKPQIKWRMRNTFTETLPSYQNTNDADSHSTADNSPSLPKNAPHRGPNVAKTKSVSQHSSVNPGAEVVEDPFDCVFGSIEPTEDFHHPVASTGARRAITRKHKRAHRRRRMRNHEASADAPQYLHT